MYCKHCGKEIASDSKFCQHCGGSQVTVNPTPQIDSEHSKETKKEGKVIEIPTIKVNFSEKNKWILFCYALWFVFNLYWLFAGDKSGYAVRYFQPFADVPFGDESYYDISEFIIYVVGVPLAIFGAIMLHRRFKEKNIIIPKYIKVYLIVIAVALLAIIAIVSRVFHSEDEDYNYQEYYPRTGFQSQQNVPTQEKEDIDFVIDLSESFGINEIKNQQDSLRRIQNQIDNLPSELDKYFP